MHAVCLILILKLHIKFFATGRTGKYCLQKLGAPNKRRIFNEP